MKWEVHGVVIVKSDLRLAYDHHAYASSSLRVKSIELHTMGKVTVTHQQCKRATHDR